MPDTVYDKLNRIEDKVDALSPSAHSEPQTLDEQLAAKDPRVFEFIQSANRTLYFNGDKSELKRINARNKKTAIGTSIISALLIVYFATTGFLISIPFGIASTLVSILVYTPCIIFVLRFRPNAYKIPYPEWFVKTKVYEYDDNDIVCGIAKDKWYVTLGKVLSVIIAVLYLFVSFFALMAVDKIWLALLFEAIAFVLYFITIITLRKKTKPHYTLFFEDDKNKIPYHILKEFMTENELK